MKIELIRKYILLKVVLITSFFILQTNTLHAQIDTILAARDTPYVLNYNDPYTYPAFTLNFIPIYGEYQKINRVFGGGAQIDYLLNGASMMVNFVISYPGYDNIKDREGFSLSQTSLSRYMLYETYVAYHFTDRTEQTLMSYQPGGMDAGNKLKEVHIPYNYRRIYAARGGYLAMTSAIEGSDEQAFISNDGSQYGKGHYTNINTHVIYAGIFTSRVDKLGVSDATGRKRRRKVKQWFADVMFAPVIRMDDLQFSDTHFSDVAATPLNRLGWRVGYQLSNQLLTLTRIELGQRPGIAGFNYYGSLTVGLTLFSKGRTDIGEAGDRNRANIHRDTR